MFGITCAPEIFQKTLEQILSGCEGCFNYIDDIIIFGSTRQVHDKRVKKVLEKLKASNVELNRKKCVFGVSEILFLGHKLTAEGIRPDEDKLSAIKMFREPKTMEETRSFLGLVNYVGKFLPDLATVTEPLRKLTRKSETFAWNQQQSEAFRKLKKMMSADALLGYFDVKNKTQVIADASPVGLGAVLIQIGSRGPQVISYASKSLTSTEKRYAQTEKEALALVWAVERFHYYLFGREFDLITDHKPLEIIFGTRSKPCARIERWVLRLQSYKYKVIYQSGKSNIADPLSRLVEYNGVAGEPAVKHTEQYVNFIVAASVPVAVKIEEIGEASSGDDEIRAVKKAIHEGNWNEENVAAYKMFESELCFSGNILLRGTKIVIPESLRARVLDAAHEGHPGISVMKRRLRTKVWWPKIDKQTEKFVQKCHGCMLVAAPSAPEPLRRTLLPTEPWQHLAIDFLGPLPSGHNLLVVVDYYSRYIEIDVMKKIDSEETIKRLKSIFARFGLPISITSDNGRQFVSDEFGEFCNTNNIKLINTTPYWPQQNGEVERQNRSILKRLIISQNTNRNWIDDLQEYLLMYRATPHSTTLKTPSELLFGRNIRDKIPSIHQPIETDEEVRDRDLMEKEKGRIYADKRRGAKITDISIGDKVLVKRQAKTNKLSSTFGPEKFIVISKKGSEAVIESSTGHTTYRRNVSHLKRIADGAQDEPEQQKQDDSEPKRMNLRSGTKPPKHLKDYVK